MKVCPVQTNVQLQNSTISRQRAQHKRTRWLSFVINKYQET